jgi:hypothetical protein
MTLRKHYEYRIDVWERFLSKYPKELIYRHKSWISRILDSKKLNGAVR